MTAFTNNARWSIIVFSVVSGLNIIFLRIMHLKEQFSLISYGSLIFWSLFLTINGRKNMGLAWRAVDMFESSGRDEHNKSDSFKLCLVIPRLMASLSLHFVTVAARSLSLSLSPVLLIFPFFFHCFRPLCQRCWLLFLKDNFSLVSSSLAVNSLLSLSLVNSIETLSMERSTNPWCLVSVAQPRTENLITEDEALGGFSHPWPVLHHDHSIFVAFFIVTNP